MKSKERLFLHIDNDDPDDTASFISFLCVPELKEFEHFHIEMSLKEAKRIQKWLNKYFEEK